MIRLLFIALVFVLEGTCSSGQGFKAPSEGKAVIYFVRTSSLAFAVNFSFFHERRFIGDFGGRNYLRYECKPGTHLFWASAENKDYLTADLAAGGTYVVIVDVDLGDSVAHVRLKPISVVSRDFERAKRLVDRKRPVIPDATEIKTMNVKLGTFINENLNGSSAAAVTKLTAEMAIPSKFF